jgi:hypothetical protein
MKPIVALMISGLLASTAALAAEPTTLAQAPATPAATAPAATAPAGEQSAKKAATHKKKRKAHKAATAKADSEKKADMAPATEAAKPTTPSSDMKK